MEKRQNRHGHRYGRIFLHGRYVPAHRAMYELKVGPIPEGHEIHHLCKVTRCVNPDHLLPVTPLEHTRYADNVRLNPGLVRAIRSDEAPLQVWADRLGISISLVSQVRNRKCWKDVE